MGGKPMGGNSNTGQQGTDQALDDRGTSETEGRAILKRLRDSGFEGSDEKLAVALGRPMEEVQGWTGGTEPVDDDVIMKARGIAKQRGIEI
ncbi:MAG: hypothetical protein ACRD6N_16210 [Pyrinomonadaceae bacterium]